jgi:hypothetical protein
VTEIVKICHPRWIVISQSPRRLAGLRRGPADTASQVM